MFEQFAGEGKYGNPSNYKGLRDFGFRPSAGGVTRFQIAENEIEPLGSVSPKGIKLPKMK